MKVQFVSAAFFAAGLGLSSQLFAAPPDCEKLKEKVEKELRAKGDSSSYVRVYEADDETDGKDVGKCANGALKVVLFEVDPS
jgi:hypothetical protein